MRAVKRHKIGNIDITDTITVGKHEGLIPDVLLHTLDPPASHGVQACVYYRNLPRFGGVVVDGHLIAAIGEVVCNVRSVQEIVCEVLLDDVLLIACADDKVVVAVVAV